MELEHESDVAVAEPGQPIVIKEEYLLAVVGHRT